MHPKLIITIIVAHKDISRIFHGFLITKTYDFANYELSKSEKPPNRQTANLAVFRRFWAVFGLFFGSFGAYVAVFLILVIFTHLTL